MKYNPDLQLEVLRTFKIQCKKQEVGECYEIHFNCCGLK